MESVFEDGDQDYGSVAGWDPAKENRERLLAEAKKKNPRYFAPAPEMLYVRPVQDFIESGAKAGPMKQLFGPFWLQEEVAVLFATPGVGKSALAVQIAESVARGVALAPFNAVQPGCEVPPQRVLYLDFELTRVQLTQRYTTVSENGLEVKDKYDFSPTHFRSELFWDGKIIEGYEDYTDMLFENISNKIDEHQAEVLICDNLTFLSQSSTANATIAFRLMNCLQELKKERFISVLAVSHTPKHAAHRPLTANDLQGSVDLSKVADSMFALGRSAVSPDLRYIKHLKSRTGPIKHSEDNVAVYKLGKFDYAAALKVDSNAVRADNFLGFEFIGFDTEAAHLAQPPARNIAGPQRRSRLDRNRIGYAKLLAAKGLSSAEIAERLGVGRSTAHRYVTAGQRQPEAL